MTTQGRQQFVRGQIAVMVGAIVALAVLDMLSLELFFVIALVGFLTLIEFTAPVNVTPRWRARLKWLVLLGLLGFAVVLAGRLLPALPSELF